MCHVPRGESNGTGPASAKRSFTMPTVKPSVKNDQVKDWKEFLRDKPLKQSVEDFLDEKLLLPLGDLSWAYSDG